jgi:aspartyl-tRNA(Asn)/glutamyl-tRNA(Gln) amidotransferase subunit C
MIPIAPTKAKNIRQPPRNVAFSYYMVEVNEALIRKVAALSMLELEESGIGDYVKSIGEILGHVQQLSAVDTTGVEPMIHGIDGPMRLREDEVEDFGRDANGTPGVVANAPEVEHDGFKVPRIIG